MRLYNVWYKEVWFWLVEKKIQLDENPQLQIVLLLCIMLGLLVAFSLVCLFALADLRNELTRYYTSVNIK